MFLREFLGSSRKITSNVLAKVVSFVERTRILARQYTPVSVSVRLLVGHYRKTWMIASIAYGLPVYLVLTGFLLSRMQNVTHDPLTITLVYLAAMWAWIGPVFIWRYEHITTTRFWQRCRRIVLDKKQFRNLRKSFRYSVIRKRSRILLLLSWCLLGIVPFVSSYEFMEGFGVLGKNDIWWYVQIFGVSVYAFITGIGLLLVLNACQLIRNFLPLEISINPYDPDQRGGLGFFGDLLAETSFMFASGSLFVPILMRLHAALYVGTSHIILIIVGVYALMVTMSFIMPTWLIHKKLKVEKEKRLRELGRNLKHLESVLNNGGIDNYCRYKAHRDLYHDVSRIVTWPFDTQSLTTVLVSVTLPISLMVAQLALSGNH